MAITGTPTASNDTFTVTPTGFHSVNALDGIDTLVVDYSSLSTSIIYRDAGYGWWSFTDDFFSGIEFYNVERFNLRGGSGDDTLVGRGDIDNLSGGNGADTLISGLGADTINGGLGGLDRWIAEYGSVSSAIVVTLQAAGSWTVDATGAIVSGIEQINITTGIAGDTIDTMLVTGSDNVTTGDGADVFRSAGGFDTVNMGAGDDRLVIDYSDSITRIVHTDQGYGWWRLGDRAGKQWVDYYAVDTFDLTGGSASDSLRGGGGNDRLVGNAGNDWLNGAGGADQIAGGTGTDTWQVNYAGVSDPITVNLTTQVTNTGAAISGIEAIHYTGGLAEDTIVATQGVYNDYFSTNEADDSVSTGRGRDEANGGAGNDHLIMDWSSIADATQGITLSDIGYGWWRFASSSGDRLDYYGFERYTLKGGAGNDVLSGGSDFDRLYGNGGDDTLGSGAGAGVVDGGQGNDRWSADLSGVYTAVLVNAATSQTTAQGVASGMNIRNIEAFSISTGSGNDNINSQGYALNDTINTNGGNDILAPGLGRDSVHGGDGTDTLVMDWSSLTASADAIRTTDQGYGWWRFGNADASTYVDFYSIEKFDLRGSQAGDYLAGGGLYDVMRGNGGDDVLDSKAGDALVYGGAGNDLWRADLSAETVGIAFNAANSQTADQATAAGLKINSIERVEITTGKGADNINMQGYAFDDNIYTGIGNDIIASGLGRDVVHGGEQGAVGDVLIIDYSSLSGAVSRSDAGYGWMRYDDADGTASVEYYSIERFIITGGSGSDDLFGGGLNDTLKGNAGDDVLTGYSGRDIIQGGLGHDRWIGDHSGAAAGLTLTLDASGTGTLGAIGTALSSIENVTLTTGNFADTINLTNSTGNDTIYTNDGNDTIDVGAGRIEVVHGGGQTDTLIFDAILATGGIRLSDAGYGWWRYASTTGDYDIQFYGIEKLVIEASNRADRVSGFSQDDRLSGRNGSDILEGGGGNDTLTGGAGNDQFYFSTTSGMGVDTITDATAGDFIRLANVSFIGNMGTGTGGSLVAGQAQVSVNNNVTTIYVGVDATAGADFSVNLQGVFAAGNFQLSGHDILIV